RQVEHRSPSQEQLPDDLGPCSYRVCVSREFGRDLRREFPAPSRNARVVRQGGNEIIALALDARRRSEVIRQEHAWMQLAPTKQGRESVCFWRVGRNCPTTARADRVGYKNELVVKPIDHSQTARSSGRSAMSRSRLPLTI